MSNTRRRNARRRRRKKRISPIIVGLLAVIAIIGTITVFQRFFGDDDAVTVGGDSVDAGDVGSDNPAFDKDEAVIAVNSYSGRFNPLFIGEGEADADITRLLFDPLIEAGADGAPTPVLADYSISADGLLYTITIKEATYSNGDEVKASDVIFTYHLLFDEDYDGHINTEGIMLSGLSQYRSGESDRISGITEVDEQTVEVRLSQPSPKAIYALGVSPLQEEYYGIGFSRGNLDSVRLMMTAPMGCGQYIYGEFAEESISLTRNEEYYRGEPNIETVTFLVANGSDFEAMFAANELDIDFTGLTQTAAMGEYVTSETILSDSFGVLAFDTTQVTDNNLRRAIGLAIDKNELIDMAFNGDGVAINAPLSSAAFSQPTAPYEYDSTRALELLTLAGYEQNDSGKLYKDGERVSLSYAMTRGSAPSQALGELLTSICESLGIEIEITELDYGTLTSQFGSGNYDMWFSAFACSPYPLTNELFSTESEYNIFGYNSTATASILANLERDSSLLGSLWAQIDSDSPLIPLYQKQSYIVINERFSALEFSPFVSAFANFFSVK